MRAVTLIRASSSSYAREGPNPSARSRDALQHAPDGSIDSIEPEVMTGAFYVRAGKYTYSGDYNRELTPGGTPYRSWKLLVCTRCVATAALGRDHVGPSCTSILRCPGGCICEIYTRSSSHAGGHCYSFVLVEPRPREHLAMAKTCGPLSIDPVQYRVAITENPRAKKSGAG